MKHSVLTASLKTSTIILFFLLFAQCSIIPKIRADNDILQPPEEESFYQIPVFQAGNDLPVTEFGEIWAYVVAGNESALTRGLPLSDIGYFGAEIDSYGSLTDVPKRQNLTFQGRVHLVVACNSRSLTHFVLIGDRPERKALVAELTAAARNFDGLQIDFENVPARDGSAFLSFLVELRAALPDKMFTIALPARTRKLADDVYDYERIKPHVDRILVMAYDEHWSGSNPGSVASMDWCRRVADYSLRAIGPEKLIMGLPFYGRAWGDYSPSRALINKTIQGIIKDEKVAEVRYENGIPVFTYNKNVSIKVFFEDEKSLTARMGMYKSMNVSSIGFWRLGQETAEVWKYLKLSSR
jgi:spore germination protein YaaH